MEENVIEAFEKILFVKKAIESAEIITVHPVGIVIDSVGGLMKKSSASEGDSFESGFFKVDKEMFLNRGSHTDDHEVGVGSYYIADLVFTFLGGIEISVTESGKVYSGVCFHYGIHTGTYLFVAGADEEYGFIRRLKSGE